MFTRLEIKRIDLWSLFKVSFFLYAVLGLFVGIIMFFFSFVIGSLTGSYYGSEFSGIERIGTALGFFLVPFMAFLYGVIGAVALTILGGVYNLVCRLTGGFTVEGAFEGEVPPTPAEPSPLPVYSAPIQPPPVYEKPAGPPAAPPDHPDTPS
jgi:hypothetical protein